LSIHEPLPVIDTVQLRQRLAGLIDHQSQRQEWHDKVAKEIAIKFCAALPIVFGESLDRLTMWDKINAAIQAGYAKTATGDIDLFVQCVLESIQAEAAKVVACDELTDAIDLIHLNVPGDHRQDFLEYLVTHLIPILVYARRAHKARMEASKS
jgi:hypothetical protein